MPDIDLLSAVQPPDGWFAVVGIKDGATVQRLVATREEADALFDTMHKNGRDVYFGVAKYATPDNRTRANVSGLKALWLDIDCGEDKAVVNPKTGKPKGYIDQAAGLRELKLFCRAAGLPKPLLVNSGRGLHVYWPLTEPVTREQWEPVAKGLRDKCNEYGLFVDPAVFEAARILRVPGTSNFKDDPPKRVDVLHGANPNAITVLASILDVDMEAPPTPTPSIFSGPKRPLSALGELLKAHTHLPKSFAKLMERTLAGNGCMQLLDSYQNRETLSEPRWWDALSVAKFCEDAEFGYVTMSEGHPDFSLERCHAKVKSTPGAHSCAVFETNNPGGCNACLFKGKVETPLGLAKYVEESKGDTTVIDPDTGDTVIIPPYPEPYFRPAKGGVWRRATVEGEEDTFIYHCDLYVVSRMNDPELKDVAVLRLHTPSDGIKTFVVPNRLATDTAELRKILADEGVMCLRKQFDLIVNYVVTAIASMQFGEKATKMRLQLGWADDDTKFVLGDREITQNGVFYSPPSSATAGISRLIGPVGDFDKWKEVFDLYGREGLELHALGAMAAFGAPLMRFMGQAGLLVNFVNPNSGTGKTTILHMCNSVYGEPKLLCLTEKDTYNAKIQKLGVLNNIVACADELTNMKPEEASDFVYTVGGGIGKDRMKASSNELRENNTTWQTILVASSNTSFAEKLLTLKERPEGEMMRILEYSINYTNAIGREEARHMFDHQLRKNYGHAGPIYLHWLVNNRQYAVDETLGVQEEIDRRVGITQRERFWSAGLASKLAGGKFAADLGLHSWDMRRIFDVVCEKTALLKDELPPTAVSPTAVIGDFIARHNQNVLVVNAANDGRSGMPTLPALEPRGELLIRYEPDAGFLYIIAKALRADMIKRQINYQSVLADLMTSGVGVRVENKRMSKGTKIVAPPVSVVVLNTRHPEFDLAEGLFEDVLAAQGTSSGGKDDGDNADD